MEEELFNLTIRIQYLDFHFDMFPISYVPYYQQAIKTPADYYGLRAFVHRTTRVPRRRQLNMLFVSHALGVLLSPAHRLLDRANFRSGART